MQNYTDNEILEGIKDHDKQILTYLYNAYFPGVAKYIRNNSGTEEEAKDIFQESLIVLYNKLRDGKLHIDRSLRSYFNVMVKLLWFKKLEREIKTTDDPEYIDTVADEQDELIQEVEEAKKYNLFYKHFRKLRKDCKKILTLVFKKIPLKRIAEKVGSKSENYIKKRKHLCKEYLIKSIKSDPDYNKIYFDK